MIPTSLRIALREWLSSVVGRPSSVLFHCAGAYPHNAKTMSRDVEAARRQMRNVLDIAAEAGVGRLVYTSSFTTIGAPAEPARAGRLADERDCYIPGSADDPYYEAKWAMEVEALTAARAGLPVVVLCPVAVFGPGDVHMAVSQPLLMAAKGRMPFYLDASFSVMDVRDVAEAHLAAAERGRIGERYILSAHNLTLQEGLTEIAAVAGAPPPRFKIGGRLLDAVIAAGGLVPGSNVELSAHDAPLAAGQQRQSRGRAGIVHAAVRGDRRRCPGVVPCARAVVAPSRECRFDAIMAAHGNGTVRGAGGAGRQ